MYLIGLIFAALAIMTFGYTFQGVFAFAYERQYVNAFICAAASVFMAVCWLILTSALASV